MIAFILVSTFFVFHHSRMAKRNGLNAAAAKSYVIKKSVYSALAVAVGVFFFSPWVWSLPLWASIPIVIAAFIVSFDFIIKNRTKASKA